ncbi:hypothetical protein BOX15_Mlig034607g1, partial [Macrostomum lignano]
ALRCWPCHSKAKQGPATRLIVPNFKFEDWPDSDNPNKRFANNCIKTTKYSLLTFLPLNLWEQFHRFANIYFVFIVVLNFMPEVSAFAKELSPIPVVFVLAVTAVKDAFENYRRYRSDQRINHSRCQVYRRSVRDYVPDEWRRLWPGDIVKLRANDVIPADILLLHSSDPAGLCYIETCNIDGETNLKQRHVMRGLELKEFDPETFVHDVEVEVPNTEIYKFDGTVRIRGADDNVVAIHKENLILRGCTIRNTNSVEGMVIYAGRETKAMMNNRGPRFKRSKLERQINKDVIWCVIILFVLCLFGAIGSGIWLHGFVKPESVIFLSLGNDTRSTPVVQAFINFWTYIIILQAMIPLALYVTVEFVKLGQTVYINSDLDMYDPERDMPAECRALNITEDLGQIEYVFTDKTGTLTENKMEFKRCSVLGHDYEYCQTPPRPTADSQASIECRQPILDGGNQKRDCDFDPEPQCADETCQSPPPPPPTTLTRSPTSELADALAAPDGPSLRRVTSLRQRRLLDFFLVMAVCNSVVVSIDQPASESAADSTATSATSVDSAVKRWKRQVWRRKAPPAASSELSASAAVAASAAPTPSLTPSPTPPTPLVLETDQLSAGTPEPCRYTDAELTKAYVAESPDEAALVRAACRSGCKLVQRDADSCLVWLPADGHVRLPLLCVMPFDADRKRMSVLVRDPATNRPMLLTKGADCAVLDRLRPSDPADTDSDADRVLLLTRLHMEQYSVAGLRTLCLAVRYLDEAEYADWLAEYTLAQRRIQGREAAMARAFDRLEAGLELLGATGVEDRLQEGAADTVAALREAGISVWVLTGDKQETAVQVGHACRLLTEGQQLLTLVADSPAEAGDRVRRWLRELDVAYRPAYQIRQRRARPAVRDGVALVLDGRALRHCLDELVSCDFLLLAEQCSSVLCCRTTPSQKAAVVGLVKESLGMQTLAIGDGANDVSMIQTADIGVGISGQEGMQAVMAADFSLARFRFLKKLLLVHGHWCYDRLARMSLYLFYKNCVYIMMLFWYQLFNGFSGQVNIGQVYQICFNLTMTSLGPLVIGILDRHLSAEILMANPVLYTDAQNCRSYLPWHFWLNILDAVWQSLVVFFVAYLGAMDTDCGIWSFGDTVVSAGVITAVAHNALEVRGWTGLHWFALLGSPLIAWFAFAIVLNLVCTNCLHPDNPYYVIVHGLTTARFWLPQLLAPVLALTPRLCVRAYRNTTRSNLTAQALRHQSSAASTRSTKPAWLLSPSAATRRRNGGGSSGDAVELATAGNFDGAAVATGAAGIISVGGEVGLSTSSDPHRLPLQTRPRTFPGPPPTAAALTALSSRSLSFLVRGNGSGVGGGRRVRTRSASSAAATAAAGRRASWRHRSSAGGNGADWPIALDGAATAPPQRRSKSVCSRPAAAASATATPATAAAPAAAAAVVSSDDSAATMCDSGSDSCGAVPCTTTRC